MACPHSLIGDPQSCSQCHGAKARIVKLDAAGKVTKVTVDGKTIRRPGAEKEPWRRPPSSRGRPPRAKQ